MYISNEKTIHWIGILKGRKCPIETLMLKTSGNPFALAGGYFVVDI